MMRGQSSNASIHLAAVVKMLHKNPDFGTLFPWPTSHELQWIAHHLSEGGNCVERVIIITKWPISHQHTYHATSAVFGDERFQLLSKLIGGFNLGDISSTFSG